MAADVTATKGLLQTRQVTVETDDAVLQIDGTLNLGNEKLALGLQPDSEGLRIFSLRSPVYAHGSLSKPDLSVDQGVLALRTGSALAHAGVKPLAPAPGKPPAAKPRCALDDVAHLQLLHTYVRCRTDPCLP